MVARVGDEVVQVAEWLYGVLSEDAGLAEALSVDLAALPDHVWPDVAPSGAAAPWVVYSVQDAIDWGALGSGPRVATSVVVNVRVVTEGRDPGAGGPAAVRLYGLLTGNHNTALPGGGTILTGRRTQTLSYPENTGGIEYRHVGGLFTVEVN